MPSDGWAANSMLSTHYFVPIRKCGETYLLKELEAFDYFVGEYRHASSKSQGWPEFDASIAARALEPPDLQTRPPSAAGGAAQLIVHGGGTVRFRDHTEKRNPMASP